MVGVIDRGGVHHFGEVYLQAVDGPPHLAAVGWEWIDGADLRRDESASFNLHCPPVQRALVQYTVVADLQRPSARGVQAVDRPEGFFGPVAATERRLAVGNGGIRFVVENGAGEIVAACAHVGEQLNPGPVGGDQIDVQVGVVRMRDVDAHIEVGDGE